MALTFAGPVDRAALARLLTIELTAQPGASASVTQTLTSADFDVSAVGRDGVRARQTYLVTLHAPVPDGMLATLHLRLSDEPGLDQPSYSLPLHGAAPFALTDSYCSSGFDHTVTDDVMVCAPSGDRQGRAPRLVLQFSASPEDMDIVRARNLLRLTPAVDGLTVTGSGDDTLQIGGRFVPDTPYQLSIESGGLKDVGGRAMARPISLRFSFAAGTPQIGWDANQGIVERLGPQDGAGARARLRRGRPAHPRHRPAGARFLAVPTRRPRHLRRHGAAAAGSRAGPSRWAGRHRRRRHAGAHRGSRLPRR